MVIFKTGLSKKEESDIVKYINELTDLYGDFYITKNNLRLFIKDNVNLILQDLKKGDKIAFCEEGLAFIIGFADKAKRKYIKFLTKNNKVVNDLLKVIIWNLDEDLYVKIKKNNPIREILLENGFQFLGGRGKEVLLIRKGKKRC